MGRCPANIKVDGEKVLMAPAATTARIRAFEDVLVEVPERAMTS